MLDKSQQKTESITIRITVDQALILRELGELGQKTPELVREMLNAAMPGLKLLLRGLRRKKKKAEQLMMEGITGKK